MSPDLEKAFVEHLEEHKKSSEALTNTLKEINTHMKKSQDFMENLASINDVVKAVRLLKTPSTWLLVLVLGIVALFGGLKTILAWFLSPK